MSNRSEAGRLIGLMREAENFGHPAEHVGEALTEISELFGNIFGPGSSRGQSNLFVENTQVCEIIGLQVVDIDGGRHCGGSMMFAGGI